MDENHQNKTGSKLRATEDKVSVPSAEKKGMPEHKGTHKRMNSLAMFFKTWATPIGTVIAVGTLLWGVISFYAQQLSAQQQALDQRQQMMLQTYLDDMTKLFFVKESQTVIVNPNVIARVKTLTTLRQLDPGRKSIVIQFLSEALLLEGEIVTGHAPTISLATADLHEANLSGTNLYVAALDGADLRGANLRGANLSFADLYEANLRGAVLRGANLSQARLSGAKLYGAELDETILKGAEYNTKEVQVLVQGKLIIIPPTEWPPGFDPKAAGAVVDNTLS